MPALSLTAPTEHPLGSTIDYDIDLSADIERVEPGGTIDTVTGLTWTDPPGLTCAAATPEIAGGMVRRRVSGGMRGATYTIGVSVPLDSGEIITASAEIKVV